MLLDGDTSLEVAETVSATFAVRTYDGEFSTDLSLQGGSTADLKRGKRVTLTAGSGSADVTLESFGGEITVKRHGVRRK